MLLIVGRFLLCLILVLVFRHFNIGQGRGGILGKGAVIEKLRDKKKRDLTVRHEKN